MCSFVVMWLLVVGWCRMELGIFNLAIIFLVYLSKFVGMSMSLEVFGVLLLFQLRIQSRQVREVA